MRRFLTLLALLLVGPATAQVPGVWEAIGVSPDGAGMDFGPLALAAAPDGGVYVTGWHPGFPERPAALLWRDGVWSAVGSAAPLGYAPDYAPEVLASAPGGLPLYAVIVTTDASGTPSTQVGVWDGATWTALGAIYGRVRALAALSDGSVVAGGAFTALGGTPASNVARWNGTAWTALGSGTDGEVRALAVDGSDLYVGGTFSTAGAVPAQNVARWDGTAWTALGDGPGIQVSALDASGGVVGVVAQPPLFTSRRTVVRRWDGTAWTEIYASDPALWIQLWDDLHIRPDGSWWIAGSAQPVPDQPTIGVLRWDGATWAEVEGAPGRVGVRHLAELTNGTLAVGGDFRLAGDHRTRNLTVFDGETWRSTGAQTAGSVTAIAPSSGEGAVVAGIFGDDSYGRSSFSYIGRYDEHWEPVLPLNPFPEVGPAYTRYRVVSVADGPLGLFLGHYFSTLTSTGGGIFRWDGKSVMAFPEQTTEPPAVLLMSATHLYAGGRGFLDLGSVYPNLASWDGTTWEAIPGVDAFLAVHALALGPDEVLYAVGTASGVYPGPYVGFVGRWDGTTWTTLGLTSESTHSIVQAVAVAPDGQLYVGGSFHDIDGVAANGVARWDGTAWHPLGAGVSGPIVPGGRSVNALAVGPNGEVWAGGRFSQAGEVPARNLAQWDGTRWAEPAGGGVDGLNPWVTALMTTPEGRLYVGGPFSSAGGIAAPAIARFTPAPVAPNPAPTLDARLALAPNPTMGDATARIATPAGPWRLDVLDLLGRRVAPAVTGESTDAAQTVPLATRGLAPGVYVVRLTAGEAQHTARLVVTR